MTTNNKEVEEIVDRPEWEDGDEFDEMFEWTDFSGNIGSYVLVKKYRSYATEETERNELKSFIYNLIASRDTYWKEKVRKEVEKFIDANDDGMWACREVLDTLLDNLK